MGNGKLFAFSAPSGAGKTTIVRSILKAYPEFVFSVSATTREKRPEEIDGKDYFFLTEEEFKKKIDNDEFAEWERFYDYYYGTLKKFVEENLEQGKTLVFEIDVKGALSIKKLYPEAVLIFIAPPSLDDLIARLKNRRTETEEDFKKRIERAEMELSLKDKFDYYVVNQLLDTAIDEVKNIIDLNYKRRNLNGNKTDRP